MATERQKKALKELAEGGGSKGEALLKAGYSKVTSLTPTKVTESKGFKDLCDECGLTDKFILDALISDIKAKPKNRKPELELAVKIKGMAIERSEVTVKLPTPILGGSTQDLYSDNSTKKDTDA